jgi:trimeric autotransporter adhesin
MAFFTATLHDGTALAQNTSYSANTIPVGGSSNVAIGTNVLLATSGSSNTGVGHYSLQYLTNGSGNSALGFNALRNNTASFNTAVGSGALVLNTSGANNTALGSLALVHNHEGTWNTGLGFSALYFNNGFGNSAVGNEALYNNTSGNYSAAMGNAALYNNTYGVANSAFGHRGLYTNMGGSYNSSLGYLANVSLSNQSNSTAIGYNCIVNKIRLGSSTVTVVEGPVSYTVSDGRFKTAVRAEDVVGLDFIQRLRPVVYNFDTRALTAHLTQEMPDSLRQHYLAEDFGPSTAIRQSGFIAQEVEAAAKAVGYDFNGVSAPTHDADNYSLAYGQFVVPLVKGMQEQQAMITAQQAQIAELQAQVRALLASQGDAAATKSSMSIFPNPSHGSFTLSLHSAEASSYEVRDLAGRLVQRGTWTADAGTQRLDLSAEAQGAYLLRVFAGERLLATEKLIVE